MIPVMISPPQNEPIENVASEHANDSYNNYNDIPSPAHELCKLISPAAVGSNFHTTPNRTCSLWRNAYSSQACNLLLSSCHTKTSHQNRLPNRTCSLWRFCLLKSIHIGNTGSSKPPLGRGICMYMYVYRRKRCISKEKMYMYVSVRLKHEGPHHMYMYVYRRKRPLPTQGKDVYRRKRPKEKTQGKDVYVCISKEKTMLLGMPMLLGDADAPCHAPHAPGDLRWDLHKFTQVHVTKLKAVINKTLSLNGSIPSIPPNRTCSLWRNDIRA